ncbi:hypothetical protein MHK_001121 [Candidatus Magnetomorum sp. HK-1]|nr:hypothetical protein MHK_001121 [Candidatus Magnetomorum sp. HK-1]
MDKQKPTVFISYAREDIEMVEKIYDDLYQSDVLDQRQRLFCPRGQVLPGQ